MHIMHIVIKKPLYQILNMGRHFFLEYIIYYICIKAARAMQVAKNVLNDNVNNNGSKFHINRSKFKKNTTYSHQ